MVRHCKCFVTVEEDLVDPLQRGRRDTTSRVEFRVLIDACSALLCAAVGVN